MISLKPHLIINECSRGIALLKLTRQIGTIAQPLCDSRATCQEDTEAVVTRHTVHTSPQRTLGISYWYLLVHITHTFRNGIFCHLSTKYDTWLLETTSRKSTSYLLRLTSSNAAIVDTTATNQQGFVYHREIKNSYADFFFIFSVWLTLSSRARSFHNTSKHSLKILCDNMVIMMMMMMIGLLNSIKRKGKWSGFI